MTPLSASEFPRLTEVATVERVVEVRGRLQGGTGLATLRVEILRELEGGTYNAILYRRTTTEEGAAEAWVLHTMIGYLLPVSNLEDATRNALKAVATKCLPL